MGVEVTPGVRFAYRVWFRGRLIVETDNYEKARVAAHLAAAFADQSYSNSFSGGN